MKRQALYLIGVAVVAVTVLTWTGIPNRTHDGYLLAALAGMVALSSQLVLRPLNGGNGRGLLTFIPGAAVAAVLVGGGAVAVWSVAIGSVVADILRRARLTAIVSNSTLIGGALLIAHTVFVQIGGETGGAFNHPVQAVVMSVALMAVNACLYAVSLYCLGRGPLWKTVASLLHWDTSLAYLTVTTIGVLLAFAYVRGGVWWALFVCALAYLIHSSLRKYFGALREAQSQTRQLEVILNATRSAMIMTNPEGIVTVANQQVGELFGVNPAALYGTPYHSPPELAQLLGPDDREGDRIDRVVELMRGPARYLHWYRSAVHAQGRLQGHIAVFTDVTPLKEAEANLRHVYDSMIRILTAAIDARDSYTHGHSERVSAYAVAVAKQLGLSGRDQDRIRYAGLLHDIGKVGIDDHVLRKHGALTPSERALMMQHPVIGAEVLQKADVLAELLPGVRWHHEWISGGGYPDGLQGDEIPMDARVIGVADALDAMTSDRPYRPALPLGEALNRIRANIGVQFDATVAHALFHAIESGEMEIGEQQSLHDEVAVADGSDTGVIRPVHGKEIALFYQLAREDYATHNLNAILHRYLDTIRETLGPNSYLIYLIDKETGQWRLEAALGLNAPASGIEKDLRLLHEAADMGAPVVVGDLQRMDGYRPAASASKSEVVIPLISQSEVLGALVVEAALPNYFARDDIYLLEALGQRLCSSIRLVRYHEQLADAATHDSLTGAFNHNYFYERLTEEVERAAHLGAPVSLLLLDLNGLKAVNETHGHLVGNEALRMCSGVLREQIRPGHLVARYGGDEFAVIMPQTPQSSAHVEADRLVKALNCSFVVGDVEIPLPRASWGVATCPDDGRRAAELVFAAERAMGRVKRQRARETAIDLAPERTKATT